jgi:hypothetical protein
MLYRLTNPSEAHKVTGCAVITSERRTCPSTCPLRGAGCYAESGRASWRWKPGPSWQSLDDLCDALKALPPGTPTRYAMAGDLPGTGTRIARRQLEQLDAACQHLRAWTYTHKPVLGDSPTARHNREAIAACRHLTVNLSADNPTHADALRALNLAPVACILPRDGAHPRHVTPCPHDAGGPGCVSCRLCSTPSRRAVIGFRAHGRDARTAERVTGNATP